MTIEEEQLVKHQQKQLAHFDGLYSQSSSIQFRRYVYTLTIVYRQQRRRRPESFQGGQQQRRRRLHLVAADLKRKDEVPLMVCIRVTRDEFFFIRALIFILFDFCYISTTQIDTRELFLIVWRGPARYKSGSRWRGPCPPASRTIQQSTSFLEKMLFSSHLLNLFVLQSILTPNSSRFNNKKKKREFLSLMLFNTQRGLFVPIYTCVCLCIDRVVMGLTTHRPGRFWPSH